MVTKWYDVGFIVDVVLFDFAKAFDVVSHHLLLDKVILFWYLQSTYRLDSAFSYWSCQEGLVSGNCNIFMDVSSDVPQGSVLGLLLFLLFVNHLPV